MTSPALRERPAVHALTVSRPRPAVTDPAAWGVAGLVAIGNAVAVWRLGWVVHWSQVGSLAVEIGALVAIGIGYRNRSLPLARLGYGVGLLFVCAVLAQLTTYTTAMLRAPLVDVTLHAADTALGFDWFATYDWLYTHPWLYTVSGWVYEASVAQALFTVVVLALVDRDGPTPYLRASGVAFLITAAIAALYPSLGTVDTAPGALVALALRGGAMHDLNLFAPVGIISMPSFHASGAVIVAIALWPVRWLRWPAVWFNVAMLVVTVPRGGHYLVDVVAGVALAFATARLMRMPALTRTAQPHR